MGRQATLTKLGSKKVTLVRCRGGNIKKRALRLETGSYSWGSENISRKTRILDVVYNASSNELVRTKTLVKGCIVQVDASPFKLWFEQHYGMDMVQKRGGEIDLTPRSSNLVVHKDGRVEETKVSQEVKRRWKERAAVRELDPVLAKYLLQGRLYARISSRPGQGGRADGYLLEGKELEFYMKQLARKKK
jgi:small subunit ribosomal protein S8e